MKQVKQLIVFSFICRDYSFLSVKLSTSLTLAWLRTLLSPVFMMSCDNIRQQACSILQHYLHCSIILLTCTLTAAGCSGLLSCTASLTCLGCGFSAADAAVFAAVFLLSRLSPLLVTWSLEPRVLSSLPPGPGFPRARPAMLQYAVHCSELLHLVTAVLLVLLQMCSLSGLGRY